MPAQKPGSSEQTVQTDPRLIAAVVARFGPLVVDLAAHAGNAQAPVFIPPEYNSLTYPWDAQGLPVGNRWLNPPFENIALWAERCLCYGTQASPIFFHVPASVGSNWYRDFLHERAYLLFLNGRVKYVGHTQGYPKDCLIAVFGMAPGFEVWTWLPPSEARPRRPKHAA